MSVLSKGIRYNFFQVLQRNLLGFTEFFIGLSLPKAGGNGFLTGFYQVLPVYQFCLLDWFYWVLPGFANILPSFHSVRVGSSPFYWIFLGFTWFYWVLTEFFIGLSLAKAGHSWLLPSFTGFYLILPNSFGFYLFFFHGYLTAECPMKKKPKNKTNERWTKQKKIGEREREKWNGSKKKRSTN